MATTTTPTASASIVDMLPLEVWYTILEITENNPPTSIFKKVRPLNTCSLVCKSWCDMARHLLFRDIFVGPRDRGAVDFLAFSESSPHIANLILSLTLANIGVISADVLGSLLSALPALSSLTLKFTVLDCDDDLVVPVKTWAPRSLDLLALNKVDVAFGSPYSWRPFLSLFSSIRTLRVQEMPPIPYSVVSIPNDEYHPRFPELKVERLDIDGTNVIIPFLLLSSSSAHTLNEMHIGPFDKPSTQLVKLANTSSSLRHISIVPRRSTSRTTHLVPNPVQTAVEPSTPHHLVDLRLFNHIRSVDATILVQVQSLAVENSVYEALLRRQWTPPNLTSITIILDLVTVSKPLIFPVLPIVPVKALEKLLPSLHLSQMDKSLATLPHLRNLHWMLVLRSRDPATEDACVGLIKANLPLLSKQGILRVSSSKPKWWNPQWMFVEEVQQFLFSNF
ncbi:hypothetical protein EIP91_004135 [Steccherinum ochraceum]|uniref:F-box domain-containing protein n=1 Tax=Steccherinum ochraceum TaxID=92696 RepID=A0A4R0RKR2_9APHY|nr:hypothetical protein EIP91_004135 [Steccherinum ochraceum]